MAKYFSLILSWPVIAGTLIAIAWIIYREPIRDKLEKMKKGPWGTEFQEKVPEETINRMDELEQSRKGAEGALIKREQEIQELKAKGEVERDGLKRSKAAVDLLIKKYEQSLDFWKVKYLSKFLNIDARNTLRFIFNNRPVSTGELIEKWCKPNNIMGERLITVWQALKDFDLIRKAKEVLIDVTEIGEKLISEIGEKHEKNLLDLLQTLSPEPKVIKDYFEILNKGKTLSENLNPFDLDVGGKSFGDDLAGKPKPPKKDKPKG